MRGDVPPYRCSLDPLEEDDLDTTWTVALAGGDGVRLAPYVERRFGHRIPKQYCSLIGSRSMLEHTVDRLHAIAPASRTLAVIGTHHVEHALPQLLGRAGHIFRQPSSRDTGLAVYVALAMIRRYVPNATVIVTPTDHYVAPERRYIEQVARARSIASRLTDRVVCLGVSPAGPDPDFGFMMLGDRVAEVPDVRAVSAFVEKPTPARARELAAAGALWSTMVTCGTVGALWELGREADPHLLDILDSLVPLVGTSDEDDAIEYIYNAYLPVGFSRDILARAPKRLCALGLAGVEWSDWGRPERIEATLAKHTLTPRVSDGGLETVV